MNLRLLLIIGLGLALVGCGEKEAAEAPVVEEAPAAAPAEAVSDAEIWDDEAFVEHMHEHADKLDDLNFALADGDLDKARADAEWLASHAAVDVHVVVPLELADAAELEPITKTLELLEWNRLELSFVPDGTKAGSGLLLRVTFNGELAIPEDELLRWYRGEARAGRLHLVDGDDAILLSPYDLVGIGSGAWV